MLKYNKEKKSIVETSCLKCPICSDELKAKDIVVFENADGDKRKASKMSRLGEISSLRCASTKNEQEGNGNRRS